MYDCPSQVRHSLHFIKSKGGRENLSEDKLRKEEKKVKKQEERSVKKVEKKLVKERKKQAKNTEENV